jgi:hypothetical protein
MATGVNQQADAAQFQASAEMLRLHQLKQQVKADISATQNSLCLLQAQRERLATAGANFPQIQESSSPSLASPQKRVRVDMRADISATHTPLHLLQAQHERMATGANFPQIQDSSSSSLASQIYQLMLQKPAPAGLNQSSMLNSANPVTASRWPNVSSYANVRPAVRYTDQQLNPTSVASIPTDAACQGSIQGSNMYDNNNVSSEGRAVSVDNDDAPKVAPSSPPLTKKRCREGVSASDINNSVIRDNNDPADIGSKMEVRIAHQKGLWEKSFNELKRYRDRTGKCFVPLSYSPNHSLAHWVKRQRHQFKLMVDGKPSRMTRERAKKLEEIGFVWCSHDSTWSERLEELKEFRAIFNNCNVPSNYHENPLLANWVRSQRYQYRLYGEGKSSQMTVQRICDLEENGFEWVLRVRQKKTAVAASS